MPYSVPEVWVEAADPGMCDFPVRRESGTGNRIPGDFFVSFFGRAKKEMPRRHEASGATGAPRHERTKKEQTPVGDRHIIKLTVKWPGHALRPSGRAGRSLPQRRPATPIAPAIGASPADCDPMEETVRIKTSFRVSGRTAASPAETHRRALEPGRNYSILPRVRPYIINSGKTPFPHRRMIAMP